MLVDARSLAAGAALHGDVCIAGAGAAGITVALALAGSGLTVWLLESGDILPDLATQRLYAGPEEGDLLQADTGYLVQSRLRYLGGSTNHWGGACRPLDPIDFAVRDWVPGSGWPIGPEALRSFEARAAALLECRPFPQPPGAYGEHRGLLFPGGQGPETVFTHNSPPTRFGQRYRYEIEGHHDTRLLLNANLIGLERDGARVVRARGATLEGNRFTIEAPLFVLALGGIENARLLLASGGGGSGGGGGGVGIGNEHDLVGRYFMDHLYPAPPRLLLFGDRAPLALYRVRRSDGSRRPFVGALRYPDAVQRRHRLLNTMLYLHVAQRGDALVPDADGLGDNLAGFERGARDPHVTVRVEVAAEQAPSRTSRVRLSDEVDELGMPRARLEWRLGAADAASIDRTLRLLGADLGRLGLGRLRRASPAGEPWRGCNWGCHHMGTTRMHPDPRQGVVDTDLRVHGMANLFVAGSSVFPTAGSSNPTFAIVALALRLADHLRRVACG